MFEWNLENTYEIEIQNGMTCIHDKEVYNIAEWNSLHDILKPPKCTKKLNYHYSPILHGCMNKRKGKVKFKNFWILLDSGCSSTIVMVTLVQIIGPKKYNVMQWHTQAGNITTNIKVKIYLTLPELSAKYFLTWKFHVDD